jgi:hypothetical protein
MYVERRTMSGTGMTCLAAGLALLCLAGCGRDTQSPLAEGAATLASPVVMVHTPAPATPVAAAGTEVAAMRSEPTAMPSGGQIFSLQQTEELAKADLAARLGSAADQISVVASASRTWPDKGLGCVAWRGLREPERVPGYEITLSHGGATHTYHADQHGRLIRCADPGKPLGPISR